MHELTLVQGILDSVNETSAKQGGKVMSCKIGVGELAQFDTKLIRQLFADLTRGTALQHAKVMIVPEKSRVRCISCGRTWDFQDLAKQLSVSDREMVHFLPELLNSCAKCPSCSKSYFEIEDGRSIRVIEVVLDG